MSKKPILMVMAAGMGSRYGGLKQIEPVDDHGHILMDYALFDAGRAGFERVFFIITEALERDFRAAIGDRIAKHMEVRYAYQRPDDLPPGFAVPEGRTKPWGTAHALLAARSITDQSFAAINADDYYGAGAFRSMYGFLETQAGDTAHAMVGYAVGNTLTEHGSVARGVCRTEGGRLIEIAERTHVEMRPGGAAYTEDGEHFTFLPADTPVSMNFWGFGRAMMEELEARFALWLAKKLPGNPLKSEFFIPLPVNDMLREGKATFSVLPSDDRWFGMTYAADMPKVRDELRRLREKDQYPEGLWGGGN